MQVKLKSGDMIKFGRVSWLAHTLRFNNKTALYIGEAPTPRMTPIGMAPSPEKFHKILVTGESTPLVVDEHLLIHMLAKKLYQTNETNEKVREML